jgi:hypothetical protein
MTVVLDIALPTEDLELIMKGRTIRIEKDDYVILIKRLEKEAKKP